VRSYLARSAWDGTIPDKASPVGYGVTVSRRFRRRSIGTRDTSGIGCARSDRTLRDGSFGGRSQALRARLRSGCPSGTVGVVSREMAQFAITDPRPEGGARMQARQRAFFVCLGWFNSGTPSGRAVIKNIPRVNPGLSFHAPFGARTAVVMPPSVKVI
jgi:hypothetical protein